MELPLEELELFSDADAELEIVSVWLIVVLESLLELEL